MERMEKANFSQSSECNEIKKSLISITAREYSEYIAGVQKPLKVVPTNFIVSFTLQKARSIH